MAQAVNFLFWNIKRRPIEELICAVAHEHNIDVLMLAESALPKATLLVALNKDQRRVYMPAPGISTRLHIYSRYLPDYFRPLRDSGGIAVRHLRIPVGVDILLVVVHLASKLHQTEDDQILLCGRLAAIIDEAERAVGHSRTVVVGDLNMNPFESGVIAADGLHALADRRIVGRGFRRVQGEDRAFFYNPMWNYFGDMTQGPPGTYFYNNAGNQVNFFWNVFDQVLVRWELLDAFRNEDLAVVTEVRGTSLLANSGIPDATVGSDHLPILFRLNL